MFKVSSLVSRVLFIIAFILLALAVWEKVFNLVGASMVPTSRPIHLMISAGVLMLFVISLQLHDIKDLLDWQNGKQSLTGGRPFELPHFLSRGELRGARPAPPEMNEGPETEESEAAARRPEEEDAA